MRKMWEGYVLAKDDNSKCIGLDKASGGYPYETTSLREIKVWSHISDIINFKKMFPDYKIFKVEIVLQGEDVTPQ